MNVIIIANLFGYSQILTIVYFSSQIVLISE